MYHKVTVTFEHVCSDCEILGLDFLLPGCSVFTVVNTYFPNGVKNTDHLYSLFRNCSNATLLAGDFNSHHTSWGIKTDGCGKRLWNWVHDNNFQCHNSGQITFLRGRFSSALDLTFSSANMSISSWDTFDNGTSSDHLPITFEIMLSRQAPIIRQRRLINYTTYKSTINAGLSALST